MKDTVIESLWEESTFFVPYYKQFKKYLNGREILLVERNKWHQEKKLESLKLNVSKWAIGTSKSLNSTYDGLIFFCISDQSGDISTIVEELKDQLKEKGILFLILKNIPYTQEQLDILLDKEFQFIEELASNEEWKFYLYEKKLC